MKPAPPVTKILYVFVFDTYLNLFYVIMVLSFDNTIPMIDFIQDLFDFVQALFDLVW